MDHGSELKKIFESKPEGRRITRPKLEDVKKDLLKMKMAKEGIGQRKLGSVIKEAKVLRGP
jgi:hypothetical protein